MRHKICWTLLAVLVVALAPGAALFAQESAPQPAEATAPANPSTAALEIAEVLIGDTVPMSVEPTPMADDSIAPAPAALWGICWTSCWPCHSNSDCPWGETCRFGVQCP